jgi:hypothetical protein
LLHVASDKAKSHDGRVFWTLLPILTGGTDFARHIVAGHCDEARAGKELLRALRNEIELPKAEFMGSSKETLEERSTDSSTGVPRFDDHGSHQTPKPVDL